MIYSQHPLQTILYGKAVPKREDWEEFGLDLNGSYQRVGNFLAPYFFRDITVQAFSDEDPITPVFYASGEYAPPSRYCRRQSHPLRIGDVDVSGLNEALFDLDGKAVHIEVKLNDASDLVSFHGRFGMTSTKPKRPLCGMLTTLKQGKRGAIVLRNLPEIKQLHEERVQFQVTCSPFGTHVDRFSGTIYIPEEEWADVWATGVDGIWSRFPTDSASFHQMFMNAGILHTENVTLVIKRK